MKRWPAWGCGLRTRAREVWHEEMGSGLRTGTREVWHEEMGEWSRQ